MAKVHLLSLGCPKNLVDSEGLLEKLRAYGLSHSSDPEESDILIVNTCGFIQAAKKESVEEILKLAGLKDRSVGKKLVVFGCLAKRFGQELKEEIPEIDALWGVGEESAIAEYCRGILPEEGKRVCAPGVVSEGEKLLDKPYAYLKISEGCDRGCSYCVIPDIRGHYRSRPQETIVREARELLKAGKKELILVAQDITSYGKDLKGRDLAGLIRKLAAIRGDFWIRLLYLYPGSIDDDLLHAMASEEKVCKYIDMPLQHSEQRVLGLMKRGGSRKYFSGLISAIREKVPGVTIRTTFIVGFPQETDEDFEGLVSFVRRIRFDRLGVFTYSKEEGTAAARLKGQIPMRKKRERYDRIMKLQAGISLRKNEQLVGKILKVLVDDTDGEVAVARLASQAPEIDGVVLLRDNSVRKGDFVDVTIVKAYDYDLEGTVA